MFLGKKFLTKISISFHSKFIRLEKLIIISIILKNEIIEVKLDDIPNSEIAFMSTSCSSGSACSTVDIKSSSTISVIKFKIRSTFGPRTDLIIVS